MADSLFSRRDFSRALGALAVAFTAPRLPLTLDVQRARPAPPNAIHLNFNENPYGPSPKALASCVSRQSPFQQEPNRFPYPTSRLVSS